MTHLDPAHRSVVQPSIPTTTQPTDGAKSESTPKPQPTPEQPGCHAPGSGTASTTHEAIPVPVQVPSEGPRTEPTTGKTDAPPVRTGGPLGAPRTQPGAKPAVAPRPTGPTGAYFEATYKGGNLKSDNFKLPDGKT